MKIALIGNGRMGTDIFSYFLDYDVSLVLLCRKQEACDEFYEKIKKQLGRKAKRGIITNDELEKKLSDIKIGTDYALLKDCNLVIESVIEDLEVKQRIFEKVSEIVSEECILASNTSSLDLNEIFRNIHLKKRCIGLHFFFPVKIIETVEINCIEANEESYVNRVFKLLKDVNKEPIILPEKGNLVLSKVISTIVCYAHMVNREGYLSYAEVDSIFKKNIMMFGAYELIDSTGFLIILRCFERFRNERYRPIYDPVAEAIHEIQSMGYEGNNDKGGFIKYELENSTPRLKFDSEQLKADYIKNCIDEIKAVIINDIAYMYNNGLVTVKDFPRVVYCTLGFINNPKDWFNAYGEERIKEILNRLYLKTGIDIFQAENYSIYKD